MTKENSEIDPLLKQYKANELSREKFLEKELEVLDRQIEICPDHEDAHCGRGGALIYLGQYKEALEAFDRQIEICPDHEDAHYGRGGTLFNLRRYEEALEAFDRQIEICPDHEDAHYGRGNVLNNLGQYKEALVSYEKQIEICPDHGRAHYGRGNVLSHLGQYEEALEALDRQIEICPDHGLAHNGRGNVLSHLGQYEEALVSYEKQIEICPDHGKAHNGRGNALFYLRRYEEALVSYEKQIEICPDHLPALLNKARLLVKNSTFQNRKYKALICLFQIERFHGKTLSNEYVLSIIQLLEAGQFDVPLFLQRLVREHPLILTSLEVVRSLNSSLENSPPVIAANGVWSAFVLFYGGDIPEANRLLDEMDSMFEDTNAKKVEGCGYYMVTYYLACSYIEMGDDEEACSCLKYALSKENFNEPESASELYYRGLCLTLKKDPEEAQKYFQESRKKGYLAAAFAEAEYYLPVDFSTEPNAEQETAFSECLKTVVIPAEKAHREKGRPWFLGLNFEDVNRFIEDGEDRSLTYFCNMRELWYVIHHSIDYIRENPNEFDSETHKLTVQYNPENVLTAWRQRKGFRETMKHQSVEMTDTLKKTMELEINRFLPGYVDQVITKEAGKETNINEIIRQIEETQQTIDERLACHLRVFFWHWLRGEFDDEQLLRLSAYALICKSGPGAQTEKIKARVEKWIGGALNVIPAILASVFQKPQIAATIVSGGFVFGMFLNQRIASAAGEVMGRLSDDLREIRGISYEEFEKNFNDIFMAHAELLDRVKEIEIVKNYFCN